MCTVVRWRPPPGGHLAATFATPVGGRFSVVAFSCKLRGACPSCNARRMCDTAAHLTDRVFPAVPVRQWVLSVPFELRLLLASRADAFSAVTRIFMQEVQRWQIAQLRSSNPSDVRGAAVSFQQRFGGALNLNTHVHAVVADGVFVRQAGAARAEFHRLSKPTRTDLELVVTRVHHRMLRWLRRRGLVSETPDDVAEPTDRTPLQACLFSALSSGHLGSPTEELPPSDGDRDAERFADRRTTSAGQAFGYSLHAAVSVRATDREGRERLLRYCARPPFSLERLTRLDDDTVAYELRKPWRKHQTHRLMTPIELLARIAALVPPPRHPLVRFHGAFAPNSPFRNAVVPRFVHPCVHSEPACAHAAKTIAVDDREQATASPPPQAPAITNPPPPCAPACAPTAACSPPPRSPTYPWRLDWATLLHRTYRIDALACPCGGRLRFTELLADPTEARARLATIAESTQPIIRRARAPTPDATTKSTTPRAGHSDR